MRSRLRWLLLTVIACSAFAAAGVWQYQRGLKKELWLADYAAALVAPSMAIETAMSTSASQPRPVQGQLTHRENAPWLLLDNVRRGTQVGIRALAVYQGAEQRPLLVDFGWIALPPDRRLPLLASPPPTLDARGLLVPMPGQGLRLMANVWPTPPTAPVLLTYLDLDELTVALGSAPYAGLLRLDPALPVGYARDFDALPNTLSADKHYGYAAQWFGFAITLAVIYCIFLFRTPRR